MKSNRLAYEKSPYLAQHAHNPVDWYPWGEEAFTKAREENKPIFLSIGYSTCYWCHVMEKECFEKEEVAEALNGFVSIKVDREEHPEVDEIYMDAVVAMTGRGGWPMSVFLTPELKPFWGGTYLPRPHFLQLLARIRQIWEENPGQIRTGGEKLTAALTQEKELTASGLGEERIFDLFLGQSRSRFDAVYGGFGEAPKFPPSMSLRMLLRLGKPGREMAEKTLEAMACGGIYDQLGGGFHRYSTDEKWLVPHFEKMLYDNALLATAYLEAFQLWGNPFHREVARETLHYLLREMRHEGGAFYAAEDAGPVGREGEFYVWRAEELKAYSALAPLFGWSEEGNFEHGQNVLHLENAADWIRSREGGAEEERQRLLAVRARRERPHRDEKILTSWNGLALGAFSLAYRALGEPEFLRAAEECAGWIRQNLWRDGVLLRRYAGGEARYAGTATDYAFFIDGLLSLYQASFGEEWLLWARELQRKFDEEFWDGESGGYFTASSREQNLILRLKEKSDGALPSANSVAYRNLLRLSQLFLDGELREKAEQLETFLRPWLERAPMGLAESCIGLYYRYRGERLAVFSGRGAASQAGSFRGFSPDWLLACAPEGKTSALPALKGKESEDPAIFLCEKGLCRAPLPVEEALSVLRGLPDAPAL